MPSPSSFRPQAASARFAKKLPSSDRRKPVTTTTTEALLQAPLLYVDKSLLAPFGLDVGDLIVLPFFGGRQLAKVAGVVDVEVESDDNVDGDKSNARTEIETELWVSMPLEPCCFRLGDGSNLRDFRSDSDDERHNHYSNSCCCSFFPQQQVLFPTNLRPGELIQRAPEHFRIEFKAWEARRELREKKKRE